VIGREKRRQERKPRERKQDEHETIKNQICKKYELKMKAIAKGIIQDSDLRYNGQQPRP
jgi:hypothetical protein